MSDNFERSNFDEMEIEESRANASFEEVRGDFFSRDQLSNSPSYQSRPQISGNQQNQPNLPFLLQNQPLPGAFVGESLLNLPADPIQSQSVAKINENDSIFDIGLLAEELEKDLPPTEHERRGFLIEPEFLALMTHERYGAAKNLREFLGNMGIFVPSQTKKGPSINYLLGLARGEYQAVYQQEIGQQKLRARVSKAEIINELESKSTKPLGFTSIDFCSKNDLRAMLSAIDPSSKLFVRPFSHKVAPKETTTGLYIPKSCSGLIQFQQRRLDEENRRLMGKNVVILGRKEAIEKKIAKLGHYSHFIRFYLKKTSETLNSLASMGAQMEPKFADRISRLFSR